VTAYTLKRLKSGSIAAIVSLSLHGLLFAPLVLGGAGAGRGDRTGGGSSIVAGSPSLTLVDVAVAPVDVHGESISPPHLLSPTVEVPAVGSMDLESPEEPKDAAVAYAWRMGALTARIQSLWTLPRGSLDVDFHCRVRIRQGDAGAVDEVEFESCDDAGALRSSLVRAIERAAPLPPLSESRGAGGADITLHFAAYAATTGGSRTVVEPGAASSN
jgi:hypothetical protein